MNLDAIFTQEEFSDGLRRVTERIELTASAQRGWKATVCAVISAAHGLMYGEVFDGSINSALVKDVIQIVSGIFLQFGAIYNAFLVSDDAPCHRNVDIANGFLPINRLPKYSSFLKPNCTYN